MRRTQWRRLIREALFCLCAFGSMAFGEDDGDWIPDLATVNHVEELLKKMPLPTYGAVKADSFDSYGRYYTGAIKDGRQVIGASFYSTDPKEYPPGIHIGREHWVATGGGCHHLMMLYDVAEDRVTLFVCYGLG